MPKHHYDYTYARAYCEELGLTWVEEWVPGIDQTFRHLKLTQEQVDGLVREHVWRLHYLFDGKNYSFRDRVKLALHFLLGRS